MNVGVEESINNLRAFGTTFLSKKTMKTPSRGMLELKQCKLHKQLHSEEPLENFFINKRRSFENQQKFVRKKHRTCELIKFDQ